MFANRLVLVRTGLWETWAPHFAMEAGLVGMLIDQLGAKSRAAKDAQRLRQSPDQLLAGDPKGIQLMVRDVVDARLKYGLLEAKLKLSMSDGTIREFAWMKSGNKYDQALGILQVAFGTKLIDGKKAA